MATYSQLTKLSDLSYSDSELDMIDWDVSTLPRHSHFFAPSGPPHHRYSTPLLIVSSGVGADTSSETTSPVFEDEESRHEKPSSLKLAVNGHASSTEKLSRHRSTEKLHDGLFINKDSLAHDLSFLATMPELCDVTFLVGEDRQPVCGVRAILAARSRWVCVSVCVCSGVDVP